MCVTFHDARSSVAPLRSELQRRNDGRDHLLLPNLYFSSDVPLSVLCFTKTRNPSCSARECHLSSHLNLGAVRRSFQQKLVMCTEYMPVVVVKPWVCGGASPRRAHGHGIRGPGGCAALKFIRSLFLPCVS